MCNVTGDVDVARIQTICTVGLLAEAKIASSDAALGSDKSLCVKNEVSLFLN